jgi:hypothetical protein
MGSFEPDQLGKFVTNVAVPLVSQVSRPLLAITPLDHAIGVDAKNSGRIGSIEDRVVVDELLGFDWLQARELRWDCRDPWRRIR